MHVRMASATSFEEDMLNPQELGEAHPHLLLL